MAARAIRSTMAGLGSGTSVPSRLRQGRKRARPSAREELTRASGSTSIYFSDKDDPELKNSVADAFKNRIKALAFSRARDERVIDSGTTDNGEQNSCMYRRSARINPRLSQALSSFAVNGAIPTSSLESVNGKVESRPAKGARRGMHSSAGLASDKCSHGTRIYGFPPVTPATIMERIANAQEFDGSAHELFANLEPHTLILGSMPSVSSLEQQQYYGHPQNAFWKIVGSALGFDPLDTPYDTRTEFLCSAGYLLWDVLTSCKREGSLDSNIQKEQPNSIQRLVDVEYPSVDRVVINSKATSNFFKRHFRTWLASGAFVAGNAAAVEIFGKYVEEAEEASSNRQPVWGKKKKRLLLVMPSTSPAYASRTYEEKQEVWLRECFNR